MTTEHTCTRCARPMRHDTALVCASCGRHLRHRLEDVARVAGEITITVARLDRVLRIGRPDNLGWWKAGDALEPMPMPANLEAAERHDRAVMELLSWMRTIGEERGQWPDWDAHSHKLEALARFLAEQVEWLRHQPYADEAWPAMLSACVELVRVIDTRPMGQLVCLCECETRLYAEPGDAVVVCQNCGQAYDVDRARQALLDQGRDLAVTPAEAADLIASWVDPGADRERVRTLVRQWAHRGLIEADGDGLYRLGPILDRWTRALAARVA